MYPYPSRVGVNLPLPLPCPLPGRHLTPTRHGVTRPTRLPGFTPIRVNPTRVGNPRHGVTRVTRRPCRDPLRPFTVSVHDVRGVRDVLSTHRPRHAGKAPTSYLRTAAR